MANILVYGLMYAKGKCKSIMAIATHFDILNATDEERRKRVKAYNVHDGKK